MQICTTIQDVPEEVIEISDDESITFTPRDEWINYPVTFKQRPHDPTWSPWCEREESDVMSVGSFGGDTDYQWSIDDLTFLDDV